MPTWAELAKLALYGLLAWWIRRGSIGDNSAAADRVIKSTAAQSTSEDILTRVKQLELDVALVKRATVREDDRAPDRAH
jgi:hypothetical protein